MDALVRCWWETGFEDAVDVVDDDLLEGWFGLFAGKVCLEGFDEFLLPCRLGGTLNEVDLGLVVCAEGAFGVSPFGLCKVGVCGQPADA